MTERINQVRIISGALDEQDNKIILRGIIEASSLKHLRVDDYQREALPISSIAGLIAAVKNGDTLPDIEIGMRGDKCDFRRETYMLGDTCWIIDGQQRVNAANTVLAQNPDHPVRIGATIHFKTTREWETERFRILNSLRNRVSPNVLLKNAREKHPGVASLYGLCTNDKAFTLYGKVSWTQSMKRGDLISALLLMKVAGRIHAHKSAGRSGQLSELIRQTDQLGTVVGNGHVRKNVKTFFEIVDEAYGVKLVQYREMAPHMRGTFLMTLANMLSDHYDFWSDDDGKTLFMNVDLRRKLSSFPLHESSISALTSAGGKAPALLYQLLVNHMNSGKRKKHLQARRVLAEVVDDSMEQEAA